MNWIKCKDRLPTENCKCLVRDSHGYLLIYEYDVYRDKWIPCEVSYGGEIVEWCKIPPFEE